jgi:hypothetical protein
MLNKIITYIQNEVYNYLTSLTVALAPMVSFSPLNLTSLSISYCFKHVMSKATLYTTNDFKVCNDLTRVGLKQAQGAL